MPSETAESRQLAKVAEADESNRMISDRGELRESDVEERVLGMMTPVALVEYVPLNSGEIEILIQYLSERIERGAHVMHHLLDDRMTAEREYDEAEALVCAELFPEYGAQMATKISRTRLTEQRRKRDEAILAYRFAEKLADALKQKQIGLQSINKATTAAQMGQQYSGRG